MPDFKEMRDRIQIVDVLYRYNIRLRKKPDDDYASCSCPLPTHPPDDRNNNCFGVHLPSNRWQCKHPTCGKINGVGNKWGDCINLVSTMGRMDFKSAAKQLDSWFPNKNPAPNGGTREAIGAKPPSPHTEHNSSAIAVKGYMQDTEVWFLELSRVQEGESEEAYRKRVVNGIKTRCLESFRAGKAAAKV